VKLQRFAFEGRVLNASRMKEARPDKRYASAVALIHRQRARALDDAADMLIRLVHQMQNGAKEKLQLLQCMATLEHIVRSNSPTAREIAVSTARTFPTASSLRGTSLILEPVFEVGYLPPIRG
jgi:hypothetical protein